VVIFFVVVLATGILVLTSSPAISEGLVESSISELKEDNPKDSIGRLYKDMGFHYPTAINPCLDLENDTRRYCSPNALRFLLDKPDRVFGPLEDKIYRSFLNDPAPCESVALYIGRVCKQENFWKILKHFKYGEGGEGK